MERKYPTKMFWFFVLTNFLFHFFYLSVPGIILCIVGIWVKSCLWIGLAILGLDMILSIIEQLRIRKAAVTPSDNPEINELMDAFCSPGGLEAFGKVLDEKIKSSSAAEFQEGEINTMVKADNSDETLNLKYIYDQLKDKYGLELTTGLALDAGFGWDMEVLTGKSILGRFYLYDEGCHYILNYDTDEGIANEHWHPDDTAEALELVVAFMEGTIAVPDEGKVFPPKRITDESVVLLVRKDSHE